ncbi:MAG: hypothetical protein K6A65_09605 [Succinivibrionaceae bacterium]|nr:hypothetical protein [Succinivibrionaceae bacterium]
MDMDSERDEGQDRLVLGMMVRRRTLEITPQGAMVDGGEYGPLFVPRSQLPEDLAAGDPLRVFCYRDEERVLATARHPYLECGCVGRLKVIDERRGTLFLDNGLPKDLIFPVSEQRSRYFIGDEPIILVARDDYDRLFATQRLGRYLSDFAPRGRYRHGDRVVAVPISRTELGIRVVVDDRYYGLVYSSDIRDEVRFGRRIDGYIQEVRPDGRLDITLQEPGQHGVEGDARRVLMAIAHSGGRLPLSDRSTPDEVERALHISKRRYKMAIGSLFRSRLIIIDDDGVRLTAQGHEEVAPGMRGEGHD